MTTGDYPRYFLGLALKEEVDLGHLFTALTLIAGFTWWLVTTVRQIRRESMREAESGALRVLLWILRNNGGEPMSIQGLRDEFNAPSQRERRLASCRRKFTFDTDEAFDRALYQLDWEGKIDFIGANAVAFRIDRHPEDIINDAQRRRGLVSNDLKTAAREHIFSQLVEALKEPATAVWDVTDLADAALKLDATECERVLQSSLVEQDPKVARKAAQVIARLAR